MTIRVGIEGVRLAVVDRARQMNAALLVSANSLWNGVRFIGVHRYRGFDVALDSGGFVAMRRYGGYRWSVDEYAALAGQMQPTWWAQMDFCCEPELAGNASQVARRIDMTVKYLHRCNGAAETLRVPKPMPVLQGWSPADYCSGPIYSPGFDWPALVGVGSVCRRPVLGPNGVLAVVSALDVALPPHVKLHLFGVKSTALTQLVSRFPERVGSMDSMAWSMAARWTAVKRGVPCSNQFRAQFMEDWLTKQRAAL